MWPYTSSAPVTVPGKQLTAARVEDMGGTLAPVS